MFRPTSLRSLPRSILTQQARSGRSAFSRSLFVRPQKKTAVFVAAASAKRSTTALLAAGLLGGFVVYQLATEPVVKAEGPHAPAATAEDLKSMLSAQHVQVCRLPLRVSGSPSDMESDCRSSTAGRTRESMRGEIMCMFIRLALRTENENLNMYQRPSSGPRLGRRPCQNPQPYFCIQWRPPP